MQLLGMQEDLRRSDEWKEAVEIGIDVLKTVLLIERSGKKNGQDLALFVLQV